LLVPSSLRAALTAANTNLIFVIDFSFSGGEGHLKSIVYGGLDGIITTFATVTSVAGADLSPLLVLVFGIAHLIADGLSMVLSPSHLPFRYFLPNSSA
jgi:hypothetical protein